jgi:AraC-like DNA-binding protein
MQPGLDTWTTFFSLTALIGLVLASWLFFQKQHRRPFRRMGILMLLFALTLIEWILWWTGYIKLIPQLKGLSYPFYFCYGPLLLAYYHATFPKELPGRSLSGHFVLGVLAFLKMTPYYLHNWSIQVSDWGAFTFIRRDFDGAELLMLLQMAAYPAWIYTTYAPRLAGDPELKRWHCWMLGLFSIIIAAFWVHSILTHLGRMTPKFDYLIACCIAIFFLLVGWLGIAQPRILAGMSFLQALLPIKYRKSALSAEHAAHLVQRLTDLFETEKIYLDPDLRLDALAKRLHSSRHHLSQALNQQCQTNFSDWVAGWRVREAQQLLARRSKAELSIKEIAWQSGFNTKAAFNLTFKKWTGVTPTDFRNQAEIGQKS